eukprot:COSAG01_NODE_8137_length_2908_cov_6.898896_3_plen_126_part_00
MRLAQCVLETELTNKGALRLYEKLGFVRHKRCVISFHVCVYGGEAGVLSCPQMWHPVNSAAAMAAVAVIERLCAWAWQASEVLPQRCGCVPAEAVVQRAAPSIRSAAGVRVVRCLAVAGGSAISA